MKLKKLIEGLDVKVVKGSKEIDIKGLTSNSKQVGHGFLYIAKRGLVHDGNNFVQDAINAGAFAILTDLYNPFLENVVQIISKETSKLEPILASRFFDHPHEKLFLAGVTGTSGKTTTTYLIKHLLEHTGLIGTIECIIGEHRIKSDLTTPDSVTINKLLKEMVHENLDNAAIEVSSHALSQGRVDEILFDVAIFTNLTSEHLDYHKTFEAYGNEKAKLFSKLKKNGYAVINKDDPFSEKLLKLCKAYTYGVEREDVDFRAEDINMSVRGVEFTLSFKGFKERFFVPLVGRFNVYNILAVIATGYIKGLNFEFMRERLKTFSPVQGRLQPIHTKNNASIFVDYSHKTDALRNVLKTLQELKKGKIITIFGCGGNRDREKRPLMARVAEDYSDLTIVTSDNPRGEEPLEIIQEIKAGFLRKSYLVEVDRKKAIEKGISLLDTGDILLIAGKGHETVQVFKEKSIFFDDVLVAEELANQVN
jgi:UDP-N-acetylmuramoyl-L-alanyl-D-glutamate--2,6-diaminopimelate ligase